MNERTQRIKYVVADLLGAALAWLVFNTIRYYGISIHPDCAGLMAYLSHPNLLKGQALAPVIWIILSYYSGYYNRPLVRSRLEELLCTAATSGVYTLLLFFLVVLNDLPQNETIFYRLFFALLLLSFVVGYTARLQVTQAAARKIRRREWTIKTLVIGKGEKAAYVARLLEHPVDAVAYSIEACIDPDHIGDLTALIAEKHISELVISIDSENDADLLATLRLLYRYHLPVKIPLSAHKILTGGIKTTSVAGVPLIDLVTNGYSEAGKNIKRTFDVVFSTAMLVVLSPLYLALALQIRLSSEGSVIFRQERIGYKGRPFTMYKYRTMFKNAETGLPKLSSLDDERVTPLGRFMRKYRLDELPQFWNVLKGDMSIVGPRPERRYFVEKAVQTAPWFHLLHNIRPGVTSWGMVKYGYATTVEQIIERAQYDLVYYENMSLFVDLKILIYTIRTILLGKGI
jgi:exopolysaccharide biosynthesis polyprenyl glycosylphosphotransferase